MKKKKFEYENIKHSEKKSTSSLKFALFGQPFWKYLFLFVVDDMIYSDAISLNSSTIHTGQ